MIYWVIWSAVVAISLSWGADYYARGGKHKVAIIVITSMAIIFLSATAVLICFLLSLHKLTGDKLIELFVPYTFGLIIFYPSIILFLLFRLFTDKITPHATIFKYLKIYLLLIPVLLIYTGIIAYSLRG